MPSGLSRGWSRIDKATFLTPNEKRTAVGYGSAEVSDPPGPTPSRVGDPAQKAGFRVDQLRNELGQWATEGGGGLRHEVSRRARGSAGTPAQEARHDAAAARAREAVRRLRELEPTWQGPQSLTGPHNIEGRIAHHEATARAAEARLAEILRDTIPNTNPSWGINRLRKELNDQGYIFKEPTDSPGWLYENPRTGEQVRIMERPPRTYRTDPEQKHFNDFYYRYRSRDDQRWGSAVTVPNK
jgi:hypothetical protein